MTNMELISLEKRAKNIMADYEGECKAISLDCIEEGYPSHGSNYSLRCAALWEDSYKEAYNALCDQINALRGE